MLLHKDWKYITDMSHLNEGCILVFDQWYSGFRILNSTTNAGTLPYINPQAARKAYEAHKVYSVTRLKMNIAKDQAGKRTTTEPKKYQHRKTVVLRRREGVYYEDVLLHDAHHNTTDDYGT